MILWLVVEKILIEKLNLEKRLTHITVNKLHKWLEMQLLATGLSIIFIVFFFYFVYDGFEPYLHLLIFAIVIIITLLLVYMKWKNNKSTKQFLRSIIIAR